MVPLKLRRRLVIGAAMVGCAACSGDAVEAGLPRIPIEIALDQASASRKVVMLEFGATWCAPCKRLERTTLVDPEVRAWLEAKTVAMHVDIDDEAALAAELGVRSVPTMVFLRPDRTILGSITGFRDPEAFLAEASRRIEGVSAVDDATRAVEQRPGDLMARQQLVNELIDAGRRDEAIEAAEHYWRESRGEMAHAGVRASFFLDTMKRLATEYPPARKVMNRWLDDSRRGLLQGEGNVLQMAAEFAALTTHLDARDEFIVTAERVKDRQVLAVLAGIAGEYLLVARRYDLLVASGLCERKTVQSQIAMTRFTMGKVEDANSVARERILDQVAQAFEALAGVGREEDALAIAGLALEPYPDAECRSRLAAAATRAGRATLAKRVRDGSE